MNMVLQYDLCNRIYLVKLNWFVTPIGFIVGRFKTNGGHKPTYHWVSPLCTCQTKCSKQTDSNDSNKIQQMYIYIYIHEYIYNV